MLWPFSRSITFYNYFKELIMLKTTYILAILILCSEYTCARIIYPGVEKNYSVAWLDYRCGFGSPRLWSSVGSALKCDRRCATLWKCGTPDHCARLRKKSYYCDVWGRFFSHCLLPAFLWLIRWRKQNLWPWPGHWWCKRGRHFRIRWCLRIPGMW